MRIHLIPISVLASTVIVYAVDQFAIAAQSTEHLAHAIVCKDAEASRWIRDGYAASAYEGNKRYAIEHGRRQSVISRAVFPEWFALKSGFCIYLTDVRFKRTGSKGKYGLIEADLHYYLERSYVRRFIIPIRGNAGPVYEDAYEALRNSWIKVLFEGPWRSAPP